MASRAVILTNSLPDLTFWSKNNNLMTAQKSNKQKLVKDMHRTTTDKDNVKVARMGG
jgi:hypothetical protein